MATSSRNKKQAHLDARASAADIARMGASEVATLVANEAAQGEIDFAASDALLLEERHTLRRRLVISIVVLVVLFLASLCLMGPAKLNDFQWYPDVEPYQILSPAETFNAVWAHIYNLFGEVSHLYPPHPQSWIMENIPGYYSIFHRAGILVITLISAFLLSISGMLYQNVFRNPLAGPGMLGVSTGVSLGNLTLLVLFGVAGSLMVVPRYLLCYGFGALILLFVMLAGRRLSGKGKPFDIMTMLLLGSILSSLLGFIVTFVTLYVMDDALRTAYMNITQALVADISIFSWIALALAVAASVIPVWMLRFRMNALAFDEAEVKLFGINATRLRALALVCGGIMILAAQVHVGMVGMISLIVPFIARAWFGSEFRKQLIGNLCIGPIVLLLCRDIADLIPFVGNGIPIATVVSVVALPLFLVIMAKQMRGWE
jgi:iron complex transport system permease protein